MRFPIEDIKRDVRIIIDQNSNSAQLLEVSDIDTLLIEEIIDSKIEDAAMTIIRDAPDKLLNGGTNFANSIEWESRVGIGAGAILLPSDFLRLVCFQMSDWTHPATDVITESDPRYTLQSSRYPGLRGNPQKPTVAIVMRSEGLTLEFYSCTMGKDVYIKHASYLPIPRVVAGAIDLPEKLYRPIAYYVASLVAITLGNTDLSASLSTISKDLLQ